MNLSLQTFSQLVQTSAAAVQGACAELLDLTTGSCLRAMLEANASIALWLQWQTLQVLSVTRAATSAGPDLDTWMNDFALARLPASAANGRLTFARFTPSMAALVPPGAVARTADGTQSFAVTTDTTNPAWNVALGGYLVVAGVASVNVPATAATAGAAGNVQPETITLLASAIPGIDSVSNAAAFAGGADAESDAAFRARFVNYINSRSRATLAAIGYAISSVQQGLTYAIAENVDTNGATRLGNFVITVNDGTGNPSASLLSTISTAVDAVRPIGSTFEVMDPVVITANVSMVISVASGASSTAVAAAVQSAVNTYIAALPIGAPLPYTRLLQVAYDASPLITNVADLLVNGGTSDIVAGTNAVVMPGQIAIS